ncbi:MAG: helix-turn-helix transcriptional regulator [Chloroflexota bacterium]|nr:helix-turn-helix transcriptional regulator [Chloroflexota bacterium]
MTDDRPAAAAAREARFQQAVLAAHHTIPEPLPPVEISARLRAGRERLGLTQAQLAAQAGISQYLLVRDLENSSDRERNPLSLVALAGALGEDWDYLGAMAPPAIVPGPGRALATARIARGWTLAALAERTGHGINTLYQIEHGRMKGSRLTWTGTARALGLTAADLAPQLGSTK